MYRVGMLSDHVCCVCVCVFSAGKFVYYYDCCNHIFSRQVSNYLSHISP